jgi:membrane associated rhomboid family serine protease
MFPLYDDTPSLTTPVVTVAIIALNVLVWLVVQGMGTEPALSHSVCAYGLIPGELLGHLRPGTRVPLGPHVACVIDAPNWATTITSMFMHGSWFHLIGNMWFLWVFGNNVEDSIGHGRFALFYVICGLAAAAVQTAMSPGSRLPMVGASGAIGGVMGAYLVLHPGARVLTAIVLGFFIRTVWVPAWLMLGYWFLLQFLGGVPSIGSDEGGVAFWAHIGGFAAGAVLAFILRGPARAPRQEPRMAPWRAPL